MDDEIRTTVNRLIVSYPGRWAEAVGNPGVRGWFVGRAATAMGLGTNVGRVLILKEIERRVAGHGQSGPTKQES